MVSFKKFQNNHLFFCSHLAWQKLQAMSYTMTPLPKIFPFTGTPLSGDIFIISIHSLSTTVVLSWPRHEPKPKYNIICWLLMIFLLYWKYALNKFVVPCLACNKYLHTKHYKCRGVDIFLLTQSPPLSCVCVVCLIELYPFPPPLHQ